MRKIPSLFVRDYENPQHEERFMKGRFLATTKVTPGCEWVLNGEGVATRKWDGTAIRINWSDSAIPLMSKRYDAKHGKTPPPGFEPCQDPDPITGHWPGWIPVDPNDPTNKYIIEAYNYSTERAIDKLLPDGTYEAIGPKINGNKDSRANHELKQHGRARLFTIEAIERSYDSILATLETMKIEGIVYHHPDGRMCKVKRSDFGLKW